MAGSQGAGHPHIDAQEYEWLGFAARQPQPSSRR